MSKICLIKICNEFQTYNQKTASPVKYLSLIFVELRVVGIAYYENLIFVCC